MNALTICVVSADSLVQTALAHLLTRDDELRVLAVATCAAVPRSADDPVPVIIVDAGNDVAARAEELSALVERHPETPVIALVSAGCPTATSQMFVHGAQGVVARDASAAEFVAAVREVRAGHVYASRSVTATMRDMIAASHRTVASDPVRWGGHLLSEREHAVVDLLTKGMTNSEIATTLHLAEATVKAHLSHIMTKWCVRDRTQVVLRALGVTIPGSRVA